MAPTRTKKGVSNGSTASKQRGTKVPLKAEPTTPERSPIKKRKAGITARQKQALIDNLQLEITERARRLRAQYSLQAQGLRSRIEIRINRIPTSLRKMKMGDVLQKFIDQEQAALRGPPVPAKDYPVRQTQPKNVRSQAVGRTHKRLSHEISGDKENESENGENLKKRVRGNHVTGGNVRPGQVLSPTSSNSRLVNRDHTASPTKNYPSRPGSPLKHTGNSRSATATSMLSNMVEKAKAARSGGTKKATTATNGNARTGASTAASTARTRRAPAAKAAPARPATRTGRRISDHSETSEGSATTVVRKGGATKATASSTKKTVMSSIRKGVTGSKAQNTAPLPTSASGRVLRKRA